ncbi:MAG: hypothetical protein ACYDH1_16135 [Anaerolineaceae bacterium]
MQKEKLEKDWLGTDASGVMRKRVLFNLYRFWATAIFKKDFQL